MRQRARKGTLVAAAGAIALVVVAANRGTFEPDGAGATS